MCKGFIRIPRRLFETGWWNKRRVWSESDAVIDLYQQANARDRTEPDGTKVLRNQFITSNRTLADKWYWPPMKVNRFLSKLKEEGWINVETNKFRTVITILDFGIDIDKSDTPTDTPSDTLSDTHTDTPKPLCTKAFQRVSDTPNDTLSGTPTDTPSDTYINNNKNKEEIKDNLLFDIAEQFPFEEFWSLYDKKVGKSKALQLYNKLSLKDREAIFKYVPKYKLAQPEKQYRKDPETFLRNRSWEDELISRYGTTALHDNSTEKFDNEEDWKL